MKKAVVMILTVCLLAVQLVLPTCAETYEDKDQQRLIELACNAFPEYEDSIVHPVKPTRQARSASRPQIAVTKARKVSDKMCIVYSQYEDGTVFLTSIEGEGLQVARGEWDWQGDLEKPPVTQIEKGEVVKSTNYQKHPLTIVGTHPGAIGSFKISNFCYVINEKGYDYISNTGTGTTTGNCTACNLNGSRLKENSSQLACASYMSTFQFGPGGYYVVQTELDILVGNDTMTFSHVNFK